MTSALHASPRTLVHGTNRMAVRRKCPCTVCYNYRNRGKGWSRTIDEEQIRRCLDGKVLAWRLTIAERREVVRALHRQECNDAEISRRTGMNQETARRIRHRLALPAIIGKEWRG